MAHFSSKGQWQSPPESAWNKRRFREIHPKGVMNSLTLTFLNRVKVSSLKTTSRSGSKDSKCALKAVDPEAEKAT